MKPIRFYSKTDKFYAVFVSALFLFFLGIHLQLIYFNSKPLDYGYWAFLLVSNTLILLIIILPKITYSQFNKDSIEFRTLFVVSKKISYADIRQIERGNLWFSGLKFSTTSKGLVVKYNKYDEVLISPKEESLFLDELLKRNGNIIITLE